MEALENFDTFLLLIPFFLFWFVFSMRFFLLCFLLLLFFFIFFCRQGNIPLRFPNSLLSLYSTSSILSFVLSSPRHFHLLLLCRPLESIHTPHHFLSYTIFDFISFLNCSRQYPATYQCTTLKTLLRGDSLTNRGPKTVSRDTVFYLSVAHKVV